VKKARDTLERPLTLRGGEALSLSCAREVLATFKDTLKYRDSQAAFASNSKRPPTLLLLLERAATAAFTASALGPTGEVFTGSRVFPLTSILFLDEKTCENSPTLEVAAAAAARMGAASS